MLTMRAYGCGERSVFPKHASPTDPTRTRSALHLGSPPVVSGFSDRAPAHGSARHDGRHEDAPRAPIGFDGSEDASVRCSDTVAREGFATLEVARTSLFSSI